MEGNTVMFKNTNQEGCQKVTFRWND